jgi:glycosyltransferase involved in cell wall biosynthesis
MALGMLRVLVLSTRFPDRLRPNFGNFVEKQTLELAARPGVEVEVVAPFGRAPLPLSIGSRAGRAHLPPEEEWKGLCVHRPRFTRLRFFPQLAPGALARRLLPLAAEIRARFPFDVISAEFSWPEGPAAVALGRALGLPVTVKARGLEFVLRAARASTRRQLRESGRAAQGLLAVSEEMKQAMIALGLPAGRIEVHRPAVDGNMFDLRDRAAARSALGVHGPLLLAVGNLIPEKGHRLAIEALARLDRATLIVAGEGPERAPLWKQAGALGVRDRLRMPGSVPHALLPGLFGAADVTIHTSFVEGFSNVRMESLACGTPLVTTSVGEAAYLMDRPAAGRIVPPDPAAIAEAVLDLLSDPPAPAAVRGAVDRFSWQANARALEAHLRRIVDAGRGPRGRGAA